MKMALIASLAALIGCGPAVFRILHDYFGHNIPEQWEHGYKTNRVIATRYENPHLGYSIGFTFPKQFLKANGCHVWVGGGYPGAELFCTCVGVKDRETADAKLVKLLPLLDAHMRSL